MTCCNHNTLDRLLEEACELEMQTEELKRDKRELKELIEATVVALRYCGVLCKVDYRMLQTSNVSIREWHKLNC